MKPSTSNLLLNKYVPKRRPVASKSMQNPVLNGAAGDWKDQKIDPKAAQDSSHFPNSKKLLAALFV